MFTAPKSQTNTDVPDLLLCGNHNQNPKSMKNFVELKTNSIHPIYTPNGWVYLLMPVSVVECFIFYLDPADEKGGSFQETTLCLN